MSDERIERVEGALRRPFGDRGDVQPSNLPPRVQMALKDLDSLAADLEVAVAVRECLGEGWRCGSKGSALLALALKADGYDGVYGDECGCLIEDLAPCGDDPWECQPGHKRDCTEACPRHGECDIPKVDGEGSWCVGPPREAKP